MQQAALAVTLHICLPLTICIASVLRSLCVASKADALLPDALLPEGLTYVGATSGPLRLPNGVGKVLYPDGRLCFEGDFVDSNLHGAGVLKSKDGAVYTGNFVNGRREGIGRCVYHSGNSYEGEWKQGKRYGIGRFSWFDGRVYEGQWTNNRRGGLGVEWSKDGKVLACGLLRDDEFVEWRSVSLSLLPSDSKHLTTEMKAAGTGIWLRPDGSFYAGGTDS
jgi:hypothetical protein